MSTMKILCLGACFLSLCFLSACGTMRGMGQDLEATGRAVQDVVD
jgi:predicted small secreted protein